MSSRSEAQRLRKQMLVMRAQLERMQLSEHIADLRRTTTFGALFRNAMPGFAAGKGIPMLIDLFKRYPYLSSAISVGISRFKKPLLRKALGVGGLVLLAWQAWRLINKIRSKPEQESESQELVQ